MAGLMNSPAFGPPFLPKLHTLSLSIGGVNFDDTAVVDMTSSRWLPDPNYAEVVGVSCLRSVVLRFRHRPVDHKIYMPLQHLDKMGMRVVITGIDKGFGPLLIGVITNGGSRRISIGALPQGLRLI